MNILLLMEYYIYYSH